MQHRKTVLAHTLSPMIVGIVVSMLMMVSTLVRFSDAVPRSSSASHRVELLCFSPLRMKEMILKPVLSCTSAKLAMLSAEQSVSKIALAEGTEVAWPMHSVRYDVMFVGDCVK